MSCGTSEITPADLTQSPLASLHAATSTVALWAVLRASKRGFHGSYLQQQYNNSPCSTTKEIQSRLHVMFFPSSSVLSLLSQLPMVILGAGLVQELTPSLAITNATSTHITTDARHAESMLREHKMRICYTEDEREIPVNIHNCLPVTRKMIRMRGSEQMRIFKGSDCPVAITDYGTSCTITLSSQSTTDEDRFSFRAVAMLAYSILEMCETPGYGGILNLGTKGFRVSIDAFEDLSTIMSDES